MNKMKLTKKGITIITAIAVIIVLIVCAFLSEVFGWFRSSANIDVDIPSGSTTHQIADILKQNHLITSSSLFYLFAKSDSANFKAGTHSFNSRKSYNNLIQELKTNPGAEGIKITVPEGYTVSQIAQRLEDNGLTTTAASFINECDNGTFDQTKYPFLQYIKRTKNRLEGYLFPATYNIPKGTSDHDIITMMLDKFNSVFTPDMYARCTALGYTPDQIITLASIIEREAVGDSDRDIVASVFWNRLNDTKDYPKLESCATVQYILGVRKPVLSLADTKINSPYNTYLNPGLPIGPIASPGMLSIQSALYPASTNYYFFVYNPKEGKNIFSATYADHLAAKAAAEQ